MPSPSTTRALIHIRPRIGFVRRILQAAALAQSRRSLARLDDRLLRDIGITREEAEAELSRPVWDAPSHWRG